MTAPHPAGARAVDDLQFGAMYRFADWPNGQVPRRSAGVYTVWRGNELVYVGMSGRGAQAEDFVAGDDAAGKAKGLWTRLQSHASGRRSGDQFNLYVCDRFVIPVLTLDELRQLGRGDLLLDRMTRDFIHRHLGYRFIICASGTDALAVERAVRAGRLSAGRPYLNPL